MFIGKISRKIFQTEKVILEFSSLNVSEKIRKKLKNF
jgi:hypothetical protein